MTEIHLYNTEDELPRTFTKMIYLYIIKKCTQNIFLHMKTTVMNDDYL